MTAQLHNESPIAEALVEWHEHLTARGVDCSEVRDVTIEPISASLFAFVDPDGVALEMMYVENLS